MNTGRNLFVLTMLSVLLSNQVLQSSFPIGEIFLPLSVRRVLKGGQHEFIGVYET